jgi:PAS domain S-box-containing protein
MSEPALLADHIDRRTDEILEVWRESVQRFGDVPEADKLGYDELVDHIPQILDRIADRLRGHGGDASRPAQEHGRVRWRQGYDVAEVVKELSHLRAVLCHATADFARSSHWDLSQLEAAYQAIDSGLDDVTAESIRQFQDDSRRETQQALAEVKRRQAAVENAWYSAKLEQSKLQAVLASLPVAVWVSDADGVVIGANPEAEKLHGAADAGPGGARDDAQGPPAGLPTHASPRPFHVGDLPFRRALRGESVKQEEVVWVVGGAARTVAINAGPIVDEAGTVVGAVAAAIDVTESKLLEANLEHQRLLAEESSRHKSRLVAALSHDARTPLHAVVLAAQLLQIHLESDQDDEVKQCLTTIRHSVRNVLDLLGDLLDLSKIDAGVLPAEASRFPLDPVLAECVASIERQAQAKGLTVRLEPGPLAGVSLETDRSKLKQVLANLLSNALRYTPCGHIRVWGDRRPDQIRIAVEDSGVGIAPDDQERIFEEFATVRNAQRPAGEGTGLGLAISRRLARLLGGEIQVESSPGAGSTFTLVLPTSALTLTLPPADLPLAFEAPEGRVIVVAEDHDDSRKTLAKVLRRMGYHVLEASDGRDVLDLVRQERPHAVLMDINMPVMDGVEATLLLRADPRYKDLPIFALTGDVTLDNQQRIGDAGVNGYLEKPVTWDALKHALGSLGRTPGNDRRG